MTHNTSIYLIPTESLYRPGGKVSLIVLLQKSSPLPVFRCLLMDQHCHHPQPWCGAIHLWRTTRPPVLPASSPPRHLPLRCQPVVYGTSSGMYSERTPRCSPPLHELAQGAQQLVSESVRFVSTTLYSLYEASLIYFLIISRRCKRIRQLVLM